MLYGFNKILYRKPCIISFIYNNRSSENLEGVKMYNPLNLNDIEYIEVIYKDHSKRTYKLSKGFNRERVIDLIAKFSDSKLYWSVRGYTRFNTSI